MQLLEWLFWAVHDQNLFIDLTSNYYFTQVVGKCSKSRLLTHIYLDKKKTFLKSAMKR